MSIKSKVTLAGVTAAALLVAGCAADSKTASSNGKCHGANECKGHGACATASHACAGQNACKGQGWVKSSSSECSSKGGRFEAKL